MDPKMTVQYLEDNGKTRVMLLLVAGVLLIGGMLLWAHMSKEHESSLVSKPVNAEIMPPGTSSGIKSPVLASDSTKNPQVPPPVSALNGAPGNPSTAVAPGLPVLNVVNKAVNKAANAAIQAANVAEGTAAGTPPGASPAAPGTAVSPLPGVVTPSGATAAEPGAPQTVTATPRPIAAAAAKVAAGRTNPYEPVSGGFKPYPRNRPAGSEDLDEPIDGKDKGPKAAFVPPPPPTPAGVLGLPGVPDYGLSVDELPAPPSKPSLANKMKLVAVIGDRAVLAFTDRALQKENKWPATLTLGHGDAFESINVVDVNPDSVTIDEDGERTVKTMAPLK
jgi:hypothetical protein